MDAFTVGFMTCLKSLPWVKALEEPKDLLGSLVSSGKP